MNREMTITKGNIVKLTKDQQFDGITAFQMVTFEINFFGKKIISKLDTKIMENGDQLVIDGDGYIKQGFKVA